MEKIPSALLIMARILSVVWYKIFPPVTGGQKGIALFTEELARHHDISCICSKNNRSDREYGISIAPVLPESKSQVINPLCWIRIFKKAKALNVTHLIVEHPYYGLMGRWLSKKLGLFYILHSHNIESIRFRKLGKPWWKLLYQVEKFSHQAAHLSLFKTEEDYRYARRFFRLDPSRCLVIPYGISGKNTPTRQDRISARKKICDLHGIEQDEKILFYTGSMDYLPNQEGLEYINRQILPALRSLSQISFRVIVCGTGNLPARLQTRLDPKINFIGFVPDISVYFLGADIFLNPVHSGGGIRVKLVEALSFGLPSVSTMDGARGIKPDSAEGLLWVAPNHRPEIFSKMILAALKSTTPPKPEFFREYGWEPVIEKLNRHLSQINQNNLPTPY